jgi:hypothetical protein
MFSSLRQRLSYANVMATVAVFIALGGTTYAAATLPDNSIGTKQLKSNAVSTKKIQNGAVTRSKINLAGVTVPSAVHANTADSATNATNADQVGGQPASAFETRAAAITGVTAGSGLSGGGTSGSVSLSSDPTKTQTRVSGTCSTSGISQINMDGTVGCGPQVTDFISRIGAVPAGETYFGPVSGSANGDPTQLNVLEGSPAVAMTARDLGVSAGAAGVTVTLEVDQGATVLSCTTAADGICTDTANSVSIPPSSAVAFRVASSAGVAIAARVGWQGSS